MQVLLKNIQMKRLRPDEACGIYERNRDAIKRLAGINYLPF